YTVNKPSQHSTQPNQHNKRLMPRGACMFFYSPNFILFFLALLIPYLLLKRQRLWLLAVANALFYVAHPEGFLVLFVAMAVITFGLVHLMTRPRWRWVFWVGIVLNVLNLAFFKYTLFVLDNLNLFAGFQSPA